MLTIKIASDFSRAPGPRYISEGDNSGELFRGVHLFPKVEKAIATHQELLVDLDGTAGFATSFLEESFGGLIRVNLVPLAKLDGVLKLKSIEEPELKKEIREYMVAAEAERAKQ